MSDDDPQFPSTSGFPFPMGGLLDRLQSWNWQPTPAATFPDASPGNAPPPAGLPIPPAQPPFLLPALPNAFAPALAASAASPQPGGRQPSIFDRIGQSINNNGDMLMALGAGIAQGGIGKGLQLAASTADANRAQQGQQQNLLQRYKALLGAGVPARTAQAAALDPNIMRTIAPRYFGQQQPGAAPAQGAPAAPPNIPDGAAYSPSRLQWKTPDGGLFDSQGKPVP